MKMKLQTVAIVIFAVILSSCAPVLQHPVIPAPSPTDVVTPSLVSTSMPAATLTLLPTSTTTATLHPILETGLPPSPTITPNATQAAQQEDVEDVIQAYFALRYQLFSVSPPADIQQNVFGELVSSEDEAKDFLATETAKLAVERKWYELNKLRYAKYEYSLKYNNIVFDASAQTATVSLLDNFQFTREWAVESVTRGGTSHVIVLRNKQGQWKIISDTYWDSWWREFRKPGLTTDEILHNIELKRQHIELKMQELEAMPSPTP